MTDSINLNPVQVNQASSAILAADSAQNSMEGNSKKKLAEILMKESDNYSSDSDSKSQKARELLSAADTLENIATSLRKKAEQMRRNEIDKKEAVKSISETVATEYEIPVPENATPEQIEEIAKSFEKKAKDMRSQADDLLKQSEESQRYAKQLKEQCETIERSDGSFSNWQLESARAHNEGLNLVFKKLGIYRLDAEYKEQVAYSQRQEAAQKGKV